MKTPQNTNSNVLRGLALFVLAVIWCELFLQVAVFYWSGKQFTSFHPYVWSPYGLVRNNPKLNSPGYQINANGFREVRNYSQAKPPNTIRVMLLGGSVLYAGLGGIPLPGVPRVTSAETISQYLTAELKAAPACSGHNIEVINTAVNMNRFSELLPAYLNEYINWEPDVVIVGSSLNNFAGGITPSSRLLGKHGWEAEFQRLVNDTGIASSFEVVFRRLSDNLVTVAVAGKFVQKLGYFVEPKPLISNSVKANSAVTAEEKNTPRLNEQNLGRFKSYASAMLAAAKTRNQKVVFFWEHDLWNSGTFKPLSSDELLLEKINPPLENPFYWQQRDWVRDFAKEAGAGFIDPQPEMTKYKDTIFIDYGHYTAGGNAFMAKVMASRLLEKNLCSPAGQAAQK
jgi:hypothetical protein